MFEDLTGFAFNLITLPIGLAIVWFLAPTIHSGLGSERAAAFRDLRLFQWCALALALLTVAALAGVSYLDERTIMEHPSATLLLPLLSDAAAVWQAGVLAVVGGVLFATRRLLVRLSAALVLLLALPEWRQAMFESSFYVGARPVVFVWYAFWYALPAVITALLGLWLGALVYDWWLGRRAEQPEDPLAYSPAPSNNGIERTHVS